MTTTEVTLSIQIQAQYREPCIPERQELTSRGHGGRNPRRLSATCCCVRIPGPFLRPTMSTYTPSPAFNAAAHYLSTSPALSKVSNDIKLEVTYPRIVRPHTS
jgi:hypothetical protein